MVIVTGTATSAGDWWACWADDGSQPATWFVRRDVMDQLAESVRAAMPRLDPDGQLHVGALAQPDQEWHLVSSLARRLLPKQLRRRLAAGEPLRLLPAPSCSPVPWELLPLGATPDAPRLVERTTLSLIPPVVRRDVDPTLTVETWSQRREQPPLYVVDPDTPAGPVINDPAPWRTRARVRAGRNGCGPDGAVAARIDRRWLASRLPGRSRLLYVGHVVQPSAEPDQVGLMLGCSLKLWSANPAQYERRLLLTAADLVRGTRGAGDATPEQLPAAAWSGASEGSPIEIDGARLWPMPPRVGLVACHSGDDLAHPEPYGLVTAMIDSGAETVVATRWALVSDQGYRILGAAGTPFAQLAEAVDQALTAADPVHELAAFQREQLAAWRRTQALEYAPLGWAALTTYQAWEQAEAEESR